MYRCQFSTDEQHQIRHARHAHPDPIVRKRMAILWHKHHGLPHAQIAELCDAAPNTVTATILYNQIYLYEGDLRSWIQLQPRNFEPKVLKLPTAIRRLDFHLHSSRTQGLFFAAF